MSAKTKYPYFDSLEILLENDFTFKPYKALSPVQVGNQVPDFALANDLGRWAQFINGGEAPGRTPSRKLAFKPVVIAFYSHHWREQGITRLIHLNELNKKVKAAGAELVVVAPEREASLSKLAWDHNLSLTFYFDFNNTLARQFRIFDEDRPVWNLFSGVDENVPLLATYVLNSSKSVVYQHIDYELTGAFPANQILSVVNGINNYQDERKSA